MVLVFSCKSQYSIRLQAILRPPWCSNTAPFLPCLPYSRVQARSDLSLSRNRQGRKSKIWSHAFLKALRRTPAPKSLQVQKAVISAHQVLSRHKEAVQLQVHEKHCSSLSDLNAKHKTQTLQVLSLKRSKCLKMKNKCFYLWRKICPKCLNENVTRPCLNKKKLSPFQHKTTVVSTITKDSVSLVQIKKNPLNHINLYWMGVAMRSQSCLWRQLYPRGLSLYINLTGQQRWFFTFSDFVFLSYNLKIHQFSCCGKKNPSSTLL